MLKSLASCISLLGRTDPEQWHPLLAVYYVSYACRFRCPYCSDGSGTPYHQLKEPNLATSDVLALLSTVRRYTEHLVLTGGEPLQHPNINSILEGLPALRFGSVILTTNGDRYELSASPIADSVTHLVFSLDTLDPNVADSNFGVGTGTLRRILSNIERAASYPKRAYDIVISSVATPHNLSGLYEVLEFAKRNRFTFAVCPQLVGTVAHHELLDNEAYRALFTRLLSEKRQGTRINGSIEYLEHMRELTQFDCVPSATLAISPSGNVFYPCLERGTLAGNLLKTPDLNVLRKEARERYGSEPRCGRQCHSACALSFSLLLKRPWLALREGYYQMRSSFAE